jgi:SAM-dependent methyltransferase
MKHTPAEDQSHSVRQLVREGYAKIAQETADGCCTPSVSCCGSAPPDADKLARELGYTVEELQALPDGANMGLSCGNPAALAALKPGETVLDLGAGGGFDVFIAGRKVGATGQAIGVDMTPEMLAKARNNTAHYRQETGLNNVEFRLGEIEHLPVADNSVDVIISNCVINLSPDKPRVFREAFRVLKPGGRLAVSDIVSLAPIPEELRKDWQLYTGCVAGASLVDDLKAMLQQAGFTNIRIVRKDESREIISGWFPGRKAEDYVASANIEAVKPA